MEKMTARERVIRAMAFEPTDRVPRYDIFLPGYVSNFAALPENRGVDVYDHYDQVDIGAVLADQGGPFIEEARVISEKGNERVEYDSWGRTLLTHTDGFFEKALGCAIGEKSDLDKIDFSPRLELRGMKRGEWYEKLNSRFCLVSGCMGLFMSSWRLRGEEQLLGDMAEDPEFIDALVGRVMPYLRDLGLHTAIKTDTLDTAVWVYDEFSSRIGPMFSPRMFERYFLEPYREMFGYWRRNGVKNIILHCDGNSMPIIEHLIDAGFTGVQSMAPTANMFLPDVRAAVGNRLVLIGGMDNIETLAHGSRAEIEREARAVYETARAGGVIMGTHSIDEDVPVEAYEYYDGLMRGWAERDL